MAQQERPTSDQDKNRKVNPQQQGKKPGEQEDVDLDEPLRPSQQTEQEQRKAPSKSGDQGCGCG